MDHAAASEDRGRWWLLVPLISAFGVLVIAGVFMVEALSQDDVPEMALGGADVTRVADHDTILDLTVDTDGQVWAASRGGLLRFDGRDWTAFTEADGLVDDRVWSVASGPDGTIWAGTEAGLSGFDGATREGDWASFTTDDGLPHDEVVALAATADEVWAVTSGEGHNEGGVARYVGQGWEELTPDRWLTGATVAPTDIAVASDATVWVATETTTRGPDPAEEPDPFPYARLWRFDGEAWDDYGSGQDLRSVAVGPSETVWAGTVDGGVYEIVNGHFIGHTPAPELVPGPVDALDVADDGTVWATAGEYVARFDGREWTAYGTSFESRQIAPVNAVAATEDGGVWAATNRGLAHLEPATSNADHGP